MADAAAHRRSRPDRGPRRDRGGGGGGARAARKRIAEDTVAALASDAETLAARAATVEHDRVAPLPPLPVTNAADHAAGAAAAVEVWECTTLEACRRLGPGCCALNFASAKNPGGGFLRGSNAQEESLCRASGLYHCIRGANMYSVNRRDPRDGLYHHIALHSPAVPVVKDDEGRDVDRHAVSFVTCPAVNATHAGGRVPAGAVRDEMRRRIDLALNVAALHRERVLALGAFGCGVFGNDPDAVADAFAALLRGKYV